MQPYIDQGQAQYGNLNSQYGQLMNDPGGRMNQIGQSYHQSPGFQFALQQALQGAGHAAAAGGMAGSPHHEQQNMGLATNLANQDYNQWLQQALGLYGRGMSGSQSLYDTRGKNLASRWAKISHLCWQIKPNPNMKVKMPRTSMRVVNGDNF